MENKILNKKGMLPRNWIILGVLISMIFIAAGTWIGAWSPIYYENDTTSNFSSYNYISNLSSTADTLETQLQVEKKSVTIGFLDFVVKGGYNVLVAVLSVPRIFLGLITDIGSQYGIPESYTQGFIILISVALIFGVVGAIFRRKT